MSHAVSFIPAPRRISRAQQTRRSLWLVVNATAAALCVGAIGVSRSMHQQSVVSAANANEAAQARLDGIIDEQVMLAERLGVIDSRLLAHAEATEHPDWSILLGFISRICGDSIVLEGFVLEQGEGTEHYEIAIAGVGRTQNAVTRFLLALERSGVFSNTALVKSGRAAEGAFTFAIACRIGDAPEETEGP